MNCAVEFMHVSKLYPGNTVPAVYDVSLKIPEGEIVTILGSSGCGKTTLLKMVNRLYEPSEGQIFYFGENTSLMEVNLLRRQVGYVIQQIGLFPHMNIRDNIEIVPKTLGWEKEKRRQRTKELLELVELGGGLYEKRYPGQLSGGQQQRVGLARALAADPRLMLLDEPFGALDAITRRNLQNELLRIQEASRKTMLFVTHDIQEAFRLGNKIIIMDQGKVVQYGTEQEIRNLPASDFVKELLLLTS